MSYAEGCASQVEKSTSCASFNAPASVFNGTVQIIGPTSGGTEIFSVDNLGVDNSLDCFSVFASGARTTSNASGILVTANTSGSAAINVIDSSANAALSVSAKGTGGLYLQNAVTGPVVIATSAGLQLGGNPITSCVSITSGQAAPFAITQTSASQPIVLTAGSTITHASPALFTAPVLAATAGVNQLAIGSACVQNSAPAFSATLTCNTANQNVTRYLQVSYGGAFYWIPMLATAPGT